jgi:hypothetical protein
MARNAKGKYRVEAQLDWGLWQKENFKLYQGSKKPLFRNLWLITILTIPITPIVVIGVPIMALLLMYIEGAVNFAKDKAWQQSVREFNWINIVLVVVLTIWLILK